MPKKQAQQDSDIDAFIEQYQLNSDSADLLNAVNQAVAEDVINNFAPSTTIQGGHDKKFQAFCRSKTIAFFCEQWGLNQNSKDLLFSLPPNAQIDVMSEFRPKTYNAGDDVNNLFRSFVAKISRETGGDRRAPIGGPRTSSKSGSTIEFCKRWDLSRDTRAILEQLPADVADGIMNDFAPKNPDTKYINEKFVNFINSRASAVKPGPRTQAGPRGGGDNANISEFVRKFKLSGECEDILESLPIGTRTSIMSEFNPRGDPTSCFKGFVASRRIQTPAHFVKRFGLDEKAQSYLESLEPEILEEVMNEFAPRDMNFVNQNFMSFAKSIQVRLSGDAPQERSKGSKSKGGKGKGKSGGKSSQVEDFCDTWGLDDECVRRLLALPGDVRRSVMADFDPKEGKTDATAARFMSFLKSREPNPGNAGRTSRVIGKSAEAGSARQKPSEAQMNAATRFCNNNDLNQDCLDQLMKLPADDQNMIMVHYDPSLANGDVDAHFLKFVKGKAKRMRDEPTGRRVRPRV